MSTFLEVVELLLTSDDAKTAYSRNPDGFLDQHGLGAFDSDDVSQAMGHAADALPLPVAARLDPAQGLASAAAMDLDAEGLSLEREPVTYDDPADADTHDVDPHDLDTGGFGEDVDFDSPEPTPASELADEAGELVDAEPHDVVELPEEHDADTVAPEAIVTPAGDLADEADPLTDFPTESILDNPTFAIEDADSLDTGIGADDLDTDLPPDLPDDFDLLD